MTMIHTQELMIGNWVLHNGKPIKVAGAIENRIASFANEIGVRLVFSIKVDEIEPIPITDELLEKCGYELGHDSIWKVGDAILHQTRHSFEIGLFGQFIEGIHFLHELQNAYFIMTKKHLKINL